MGGPIITNKKSEIPHVAAELQHNPHSLLRAVLIMVAYLLAFVILDLITRQFEVLPGIVAWYPPAGLTYTLLLVFGVRYTPAVTIALFLSNIFIYHLPQPSYQLFLWALIISLIYSAAAAFLQHRIHFDWQLRKLRDVVWFVFTTVLVSALLAILSVLGSALSGNIPQNDIFRAIFNWWIGETVGVLTVTPFMLIYVMPTLKRFTARQQGRVPAGWSFPRPTLSAIVQVFSLAFTLYWVFGAPIPDEYRPLFLITLPLIWIALERGLKGASAAILLLNTGVMLAVWLFRFDSAQLAELELLMIVTCVVGLLMGAVVTERKQVEQEIVSLSKFPSENPNPILRLSRDGTVIYANAVSGALLSMWGCAVEGSAPQFWIDLTTQVLASRENKNIDINCDGKVYSMFITPVTERDYVNLYAEDITDRKRNELIQDAIYRITQAAISSDGIDALYHSIHSILGELIPTENFFIALSDPVKGLISFPYCVDQYDEPPIGMAQVQGLTGYVIRTGRPLLATREIFDRLVGQGEVEAVGTVGVDWMGAPLKVKGQIIGVMVVQSYTEGIHFHQEDLNLLEFVSAQVAQAIERKQAEDALRQSEAELRALFASMHDAVLVIDRAGVYRKIAPTSPELLITPPQELLGKNVRNFFPFEQAEAFIRVMQQVLDTKQTAQIEYDLIFGERTLQFETSISPMTDDSTLWVVHDITKRKGMEEEIRKLSLTDELTGLYNRRGFTLLAEQELKLACRVKRNLLLFFCDVDDLKTINDSHGHAQGDLALKDISTILKKTFRETDIIARLGGDEFVVLDVDASMENAELLATRLQAVLEAHNRQAHQPYKLSISLGIALFDPETPCPLNDLIAQADALMYAQKPTGKRKQ